MEVKLFRDRLGITTPNGRPRRKPVKIVEHFSRVEEESKAYHRYYLLSNTSRQSTIGANECISSRPPLSFECLLTPSPCRYNIPTAIVSDRRGCLLYRQNYFSKTEKVGMLPTPCTYNIPTAIGYQCPTMRNCPSFTIGKGTRPPLTRKGCEDEPGPCSYDIKKHWAPSNTRPLHLSKRFTKISTQKHLPPDIPQLTVFSRKCF